jgi:hypothetical protein
MPQDSSTVVVWLAIYNISLEHQNPANSYFLFGSVSMSAGTQPPMWTVVIEKPR